MFGEIISGLGSVIGGLFGKSSADKAAQQNLKFQRQFAQRGIQWRVQDAEKAGVHPLYALGAQTHSFQPSFVGDNSLGQGIAQAGQDIGRAVSAGGTAGDRRVLSAMNALALERAGLENELLRGQIRQVHVGTAPARPMGSAGVPTTYVIPGQGDAVVSSASNLVEPDRAGGRVPLGPFGAVSWPGNLPKAGDLENQVGEISDWIVPASIAAEYLSRFDRAIRAQGVSARAEARDARRRARRYGVRGGFQF